MREEIIALWKKIGEIEQKLSAFTDVRHSESMEHITDGEDTIDSLMTEVIPKHDESISGMEDTLDDLLTNILPELMGE